MTKNSQTNTLDSTTMMRLARGGNNDRRLLASITPETRVSRMVSETGDPPWVTDPGSCRWFYGDERPVRVRVVP